MDCVHAALEGVLVIGTKPTSLEVGDTRRAATRESTNVIGLRPYSSRKGKLHVSGYAMADSQHHVMGRNSNAGYHFCSTWTASYSLWDNSYTLRLRRHSMTFRPLLCLVICFGHRRTSLLFRPPGLHRKTLAPKPTRSRGS